LTRVCNRRSRWIATSGRDEDFHGGLTGSPAGVIFPAMATPHLLSTDFDGTLIGFPSDGGCTRAFAEAIEDHHRNGGLWAVNTGRGLPHALEGLEKFRAPVTPDFLLTNEREVFRRTSSGSWEAHGGWNERCREIHETFFDANRGLFEEIHVRMTSRGDVRVIEEDGRPVGLVTASERIMEEVAIHLESMARAMPDFSFQRNTIYLRFCHAAYHKGTALAELCRLEGLDPGGVFAAGDHYNDLPMLNPLYAAHLACPSNAIAPVKDAVTAAGGIVAGKPFADGVAEALDLFTERLDFPASRAA
jgi:hydroxymethylpyrimidine pyrophosphatase-like HAD family hydrolase